MFGPMLPVAAPGSDVPRLPLPRVLPTLPLVELPALDGFPVDGWTAAPVDRLVKGAVGMAAPGGVAGKTLPGCVLARPAEPISVVATDSRCCVPTRVRASAPEIVVEIAPAIVRARVTGPVAAIVPAQRIAPRVVATGPREAVIARRLPTAAAPVQAIEPRRPIAVAEPTVAAP